ncbi:Photosystem II reaction center Psb28 protein [Coccomyxa viridis]|uniref:Photosystem II reaction center Psb28 protein n=1 Tax=Coccomyxa viridis TaxID=1274662 RepID=A0AAV1HYD2_9CHLO|nr:Photosystem II reaction center Psb28 protein [Coccomyxa viridis]
MFVSPTPAGHSCTCTLQRLNIRPGLGRLCARKVQQQSSQSTTWQRIPTGATIFSMASSIQFIKGVNEPTVPDVRLTRARDGSSGTASFIFKEPSVFEAGNELGDITGMFLVDDEGTLNTVDVQAKFLNGKPDRIEAKYIMRSGFEWDRFMRFMERYAEENDLGFTKNKKDNGQ